jgi:hypothetical protein
VTIVAPRRPQTDHLHTALREAADGTDHQRAYYSGYALGFMAAFVDTDVLRDVLTDAEKSWVAAPYPFDQAIARYSMLGSGTMAGVTAMLHDSGVLTGFSDATAERPDAVSCTGCERRILTDDVTDAEECGRHGWCHIDCRTSICRAGLWPQGCFERD